MKGVAVLEYELSLNQICPGQHATVCAVKTDVGIRRRLLDIGLVPNTDVECLGRSVSGDPSAYLIRGAVVALRREDCKKIFIKY